jgi:hypothetical protein
VDAARTTAADRKQIVRLVIKEVALDQSVGVVWQTGATSEHWVQRRVQSYTEHADAEQIRNRIIELNTTVVELNTTVVCVSGAARFRGSDEATHVLRAGESG